MASGDKNYLADKTTLDAVNSKIGTTNDSESVGSVMAKLNELISKLESPEASNTGVGIQLCNKSAVFDNKIISTDNTVPIYAFIPPVSGVYTISITGNTYNSAHQIDIGALTSELSNSGNVIYGIREVLGTASDNHNINTFGAFEKLWQDYLKNPSTADSSYLLVGSSANTAVRLTSTPQTLKGTVICKKDEPTMILAYNGEGADVTIDIDNITITYGNN